MLIAACETLYCTADVGLLAEVLLHLDCTALKRVVVFTSTSIIIKMDSEIAAEREYPRRSADGG